jgi:chitodextrinase
MRSASAFVAFLFFLPLQAAPARPADGGYAFRVSVYANASTAPGSIPYDRIDGLVLAFVNPVDDCRGFSMTTIPWAREIVRRARTQNAKGHPIAVTFAIGGGGNDTANQRLEAIASRQECRTQFAGQVARILTENDLDGVDLDWEFPKATSLGNYTLLVQALRASIGRKILSIAIYDDAGRENPTGLTKAVFPFVDYYMVMAYLAPPDDAIDRWDDPPWDIPESKLRLGLAFFGDPDNGGSGVGYNRLLKMVPPSQAGPCGDRLGMYKINGLRTTGELTRFAMTQKLGGITAWELGQDRTDSISLLRAASETARMWEGFAEWQPGTKYAAGTVIQNQGHLWMVKSPSAKAEPSLKNRAYLQYERVSEWWDQAFYCGGEEVWFDGTVYRAVRDPMLSETDLSPTGDPSLWTKLYTAPRYDDSKTYQKGERVFFDGSVYVAKQTTRGLSPAKASGYWSPFVDTEAFDSGTAYSAGATVRYMGNRYISVKAGKGSNPVVATDVWQLLRK